MTRTRATTEGSPRRRLSPAPPCDPARLLVQLRTSQTGMQSHAELLGWTGSVRYEHRRSLARPAAHNLHALIRTHVRSTARAALVWSKTRASPDRVAPAGVALC